jgi:hypothetical protein
VSKTLPWSHFRKRHPEYRGDFWQKCRAFYSGGNTLLGNEKLMLDVFPKHQGEEDLVYQERVKRAFYLPYPAEIIDMIVAGLFGDKLLMVPDEGEAKPDPFYTAFYENCAPPRAKQMPFNTFLRRQVLDGLIAQTMWCMVDKPDGIPTPTNQLEEEKSGANTAYLIHVNAECVVDWETDDDGELLWCMVHDQINKRASISDNRSMVTERFTVYTRDSWEQWEIKHKVDKEPDDKDEVTMVDDGVHTVGKVPMVRTVLPDGLWAMGKICDIAREHFNKRCALSWAQYKQMFPIFSIHLQKEDVGSPATSDPSRAVAQRVGPGRVWVGGEKDDLRYTSPDSQPFMVAMEDLAHLRDEMHRVLHTMALSVDNSAAALQRSAESKAVDQAATAIVLGEIGRHVREHACLIYQMVEQVRNDSATKWAPDGMDSFDEQSLGSMLAEAQVLELVSMPSAHFAAKYKTRLAKRVLGEWAQESDLDIIEAELRTAITNEFLITTMQAETTSGYPKTKA